MERGSIIVISIIIVAVIAALVIAYYQSTSTKVVAAQCDKTKKICQVQSETTHFGGYFPVYSYYYVPFLLYGPSLGIYYPGLILNTPSVCSNCLTKITSQDEQDVLNFLARSRAGARFAHCVRAGLDQRRPGAGRPRKRATR